MKLFGIIMFPDFGYLNGTSIVFIREFDALQKKIFLSDCPCNFQAQLGSKDLSCLVQEVQCTTGDGLQKASERKAQVGHRDAR